MPSPAFIRRLVVALALIGLLGLGGCGGIFYGEMGDWEPGQVGALPAPAAQTSAQRA